MLTVGAALATLATASAIKLVIAATAKVRMSFLLSVTLRKLIESNILN
jgi:hypothetical protein